MAQTITLSSEEFSSPLSPSERKAVSLVLESRDVKIETTPINGESQHPASTSRNLLHFLDKLSVALSENDQPNLAVALTETIQRATSDSDFGGFELSSAVDSPLSTAEESQVLFLLSAYVEAMNSAERARTAPKPLTFRPPGRRGMTMAEKILAMHDVTRKGWVQPGEVVQVDVDWVLASELSWAGMEKVYERVGRPGIFRNDRFWLAGDHRVEPELYDQPLVRSLMNKSERARDEFKMTDFQGFNYTILHTEFVRSRAQPGMLCIGADSHSCSAGAVSCLSIGMGGADVCIPLITGQTWFSVPETTQFRLVGKPPKGVGGKDTILYILGQFKRNTVAADRVVEFTGPGVVHLSCDARFAIANMCTEFGAVSGIFESDQQTSKFINRRRIKKHKDAVVYFKADEDAQYAESFEIDLSKVESFIALYPSPDNVVPVGEVAGTELDGTFIGACTTAEEDLILGAMILDAGFGKGMKPTSRGRRIVVPGSKPIRHKLEKLGLIDIYRRAGFKVGVPGCSMCIGQGVDEAARGEKWLSSQNRNFENRMGPGSIANLASAATVAASSFDMRMTDPQQLLDAIDMEKLQEYLGYQPFDDINTDSHGALCYSEPFGVDQCTQHPDSDASTSDEEVDNLGETTGLQSSEENPGEVIKGLVMRLGDFIDTDAIAPSKFLASASTNEELGAHCMEFFMPEFREQVRDGQNIIVGGRGFGCGSSREMAVNALMGAGVKCVIAKSFAFIYARNQPNIGLLGITITEDEFFQLAQQGEPIEVSLEKSEVRCGGKSFGFNLSNMEKQLIAAGGLTGAFMKFGKQLFDTMCRPTSAKIDSKNTVRDMESLVM